MARKIIWNLKHLRRDNRERQSAWLSRIAITKSFLAARVVRRECKYRLYQSKQAKPTKQVPDFTLTCSGGKNWAIEIGITGNERTENLERAGYQVLKVGRGREFDFMSKVLLCRNCPHKKSTRSSPQRRQSK